MNEYIFEELHCGFTESFSVEITQEMEEVFRQLSGDNNPLHKDDAFAKEIGHGKFKSHISFGMLTAALYSTFSGMYLPGKYSLIHSLEIKFQKPVYAGDVLTITGTVEKKQSELKLLNLRVKIINQDNQCVSKANMKVLVLK